jgi:glutathione S-transferase
MTTDTAPLTLVSHHLCPYVQRAAIVLAEKGVAHERRWIDLADKPDWFRAISPLGKVPLLLVGDAVLFESAAICEFLDETTPGRLHPADPVDRARHRAWMEFGSAVLSGIAGLYGASDGAAFDAKRRELQGRFQTLEAELGEGPWFAGRPFSLVDAVFGPVFRYFDVLDAVLPDLFEATPVLRGWRARLATRSSVRDAVKPDYPQRLRSFLLARGSHLSRLMAAA